jgi:glycosyltransferase involved in cell wall biosynthesis
MKILYVSQYFPPEIGAPSARVSELARHWAESGHDVTVLTGFPNHPTGELHPDYRKRWRRLVSRERDNGVDVVRTFLIPLPNRKSWERIANYASFCVSAALRGMFLRRPDVVIGTSPQLLVGLSGWWISRIKRVPFVFEVRDIWPDAILASGVGREGTFFARSLRAISRFLHKRADVVVVVTPAFRTELVEKWGVPDTKIEIVQNGVETKLFSPDGSGEAAARSLGIDGKFVVSYVGTIGYAHGLGSILDAAQALSEKAPDISWLIVGEGAERVALETSARERGLDNVVFAGQRPRAEVAEILQASDVCLVLLKESPVFETVIPTKMLEFMAAGRPIVLGVAGQAREIVDAAGAGLFVPPEDPGALAEAVLRLREDPDLRRKLGRAGRTYIEEHLSRGQTAARYMDILGQIVHRGASGSSRNSGA